MATTKGKVLHFAAVDERQLDQLVKERASVYRVYDGRRVKAIRTNLGLSVRDFAMWVGVATSTIYRWQNGHRPSHLAQRAIYQMETFFFPTRKREVF